MIPIGISFTEAAFEVVGLLMPSLWDYLMMAMEDSVGKGKGAFKKFILVDNG